jgi:putative ABC transport system ATP-binding protein
MPFIEIDNVVKSYGSGPAKVDALRGVSNWVDQGEFVAVMGPSGSGKSTLLSILGALNAPTTGEYRVDGMNVYGLTQNQRSDFRREYLGFVFQNFHLIPYLSLLENVMLPLAVKKMKASDKRDMARAALARVGLADKSHRLPNEVSGGEQERTAVARAIVNKPPVLLADEPTGNLDGTTGREVMSQLGSLHREGMTIVMVTHSEEYSGHADRVIRLEDGRLSDASPDYTAAARVTPAARIVRPA